MKKLILRLFFLAVFIAVLALSTVKCPIDGSGAYFTGETKTAENGKLMKLYRCNMYGHEFWVVE